MFAEYADTRQRRRSARTNADRHIGEPAAVEVETHARTGFARVDLAELGVVSDRGVAEVPVTHLKIFGWYDNELGSYTRRMCDLCHYLADRAGL
jgi:glyceraldehyde 3-phosphate dehydrogenase